MSGHKGSNKNSERIRNLLRQSKIFMVVEAAIFVALLLSPISLPCQTEMAAPSSKMYGYAEIKPLAGDEEKAVAYKVEGIKKIPADAFEARKFISSGKVSLPYRLLRPEGYDAGKKYPLVVVLHGSGAIGEDNVGQLGIFAKSWAQPEYRNKYPCFVIAPQFPSRSVEYVRSSSTGTNVSRPLPPLYAAIELIKSFAKEFNVDRNRIYIMGFSMGGSSAMNALFLEPEMFAAAISIAGIPDPQMAARIKSVPLWIMHGNRDTENEFGVDKLMYEALVKVGAKRVRFWEFDGLEHEVPARLFGTSELPQWLFRQRR